MTKDDDIDKLRLFCKSLKLRYITISEKTGDSVRRIKNIFSSYARATDSFIQQLCFLLKKRAEEKQEKLEEELKETISIKNVVSAIKTKLEEKNNENKHNKSKKH